MYISSMLSYDRKNVVVWERNHGTRVRKTYKPDFSFFVQDEEGEFEDIYGNKLARQTFDTFDDFKNARNRNKLNEIAMYESDIALDQKALAQKYYNKPVGPVNISFFDIEVDFDKSVGFPEVMSSKDDVPDAYAPINSIAIYHTHTKKRIIYAVPPQYSPYGPTEKHYTIDDISTNVTEFAEIVFCKSEKELIDKFLYAIRDTDLLCGWNSDYYDIPYIYKRIQKILGKRSLKRLCFPQSRTPSIRTIERTISAGFNVTDEVVRLNGRTSLDYKIIFEKFEQENKASYALAFIADEEVPHVPKLKYEGSLYDLYRRDFSYYLEYNMIDTEILVELEKKFGYLNLALELSHMATGQINSVYGTIKIAELAIINYCHNVLNKRVPDSKTHDYFSKYGGAFVLDCQSGEHKWTGSVDVVSLYPTGIMSTNASPETLIGQFVLEHDAYLSMYNNELDVELLATFEDGTNKTKTVSQWKKYLRRKNYTISGYGTIFDQNIKGFIPAVLELWFAERKEYKKKKFQYENMLETLDNGTPEYNDALDKMGYYNRLQYIKKIQLNSLYGCMGNKFFKFFDIRLAESTTKTGREILMHMARHIGKELDGEYVYPNDSIIYGDTDSCYFKTHTHDLPTAKRLCMYIEKSINKSFPTFMKDKFFCDDTNAARVRVENEIISDIGIFVKKKIYLLHLVHSDGHDVDKMKIMGHSIKKTTLTPIVKKALTTALERYFKTHEWSEFNKEVVKFKRLLLTTKVFEDYGIPKKVNKIEEYTQRLEDNEPNLRLPGGQAAAILWNICVEEYGDNESPYLTSQMSVRIYYLTTKIGRFSSIAVPVDLLVTPPWFKKHILPLIDREKQIEKMVDLTLQNICDSIGRQIPTGKAVLADEVLVF